MRAVKFDGLRGRIEEAGGSTEPVLSVVEGLAEVLKSWLIIFLAFSLLPALVVAASSLSPDGTNLSQQGPTVRIEPVQSTVAVDESFTVSVMIDEVSDLGGFQFYLLYTASIVTVDDVTMGDFLGSTGRSVIILGPTIDNEAGEVSFGGFTLFPSPPGPDGTGELAIISLTAQGEGESYLDLQDVQVFDTGSDPQEATVEDGSVVVGTTLTPTSTPTWTPTATSTPTPTATPTDTTTTSTGTATPTATQTATAGPTATSTPTTTPTSTGTPTPTPTSTPMPTATVTATPTASSSYAVYLPVIVKNY